MSANQQSTSNHLLSIKMNFVTKATLHCIRSYKYSW